MRILRWLALAAAAASMSALLAGCPSGNPSGVTCPNGHAPHYVQTYPGSGVYHYTCINRKGQPFKN